MANASSARESRDTEATDSVSAAPDSARRTPEQERRVRRIMDAAIALAEEGGYEAVRLREVADRAEVAMATLYRYFRSKEEILLTVMGEEFSALEKHLADHPAQGDSPTERIMAVIRIVTRGLVSRPDYGRAILRALSSGQPSAVAQVSHLHNRLGALLLSAIRERTGESFEAKMTLDQMEPDQARAWILDRIWFGSIVGWAGGILEEEAVLSEVRAAAKILFLEDGSLFLKS